MPAKKTTTKKTPTKSRKKIIKKKVGRPLIIDASIVSKLEELFSYGATDEYACQEVGISRATLFRYIEQHPDFGDKKEHLKKQTDWIAQKVLIDDIKLGGKENAKWWLEKKAKGEFSARPDAPINEININTSSQAVDKLNLLIQQNNA